MDLRKTLALSRKSPAQSIELLWETVYKHNVKIDTLSSILAFYMHHRVYPPPVQKAFDALLMAFTDSKVPKKMKTLLFQTVEEMCHWLVPSCITETVTLSMTSSVVAELLPCFMINQKIPLPNDIFHERLINALTSPGLTRDDRTKVLGYLMNSPGLSPQLESKLNKLLITWLSYSRTAQTTGTLFKTSDVTEVDGSPGLGLCTVLTLATAVTDLHLLSLVAFSNVRRYLFRTRDRPDSELINAVFMYCTSLIAQASKSPNISQDKQLIASVLEEVLLVMRTVKEVNISFQSRCQLTVSNVQQLATQLKLTPLLVAVWNYQLSLAVAEEEVRLSKKMLTSVIQAEYSQGSVSQQLAWVIAEYGGRPPLSCYLPRYTPNILKLIATHPSSLVEEFLDIVPNLGSDDTLVVEMLHSLLDLPALSASVCIHQTPLLTQAGIKVPAMVAARQAVEASHFAVYQHFMRTEASAGQTEAFLNKYPDYWQAVWPILSCGLVQVCAQVSPLLLRALLDSVSCRLEVIRLVFPVLLSRIALICPIMTYQAAVFGIVGQYVTRVCGQQPQLLEDPCVSQFLSVSAHTKLCPQLYIAVVSVVGDYVNSENLIISMVETLEAVLRETMSVGAKRNIEVEVSLCTALAKLGSRSLNLIPRVIAAFEKVGKTLANVSETEKEVICQHIKELIRILKNPRVAGVVLSPSSKEEVAIAALVRVLFQFLE